MTYMFVPIGSVSKIISYRVSLESVLTTIYTHSFKAFK